MNIKEDIEKIRKRKIKDTCTSVEKLKPIEETDWNRGGCSRMELKFYAVLKSTGKYETEDDNYANFSGHHETTPKFSSMAELMKYLNDNHIHIGSKIKRKVPINNWEDKPYTRTVWLPITSIEYVSEYHIESDVRMKVSEERTEGIVNNPKFDGDEDKLKVELHKSFIQNLYTQTRFAKVKQPENGSSIKSVTMNFNELLQLFKILGIEEEKEEKCNTNSEEEK